MVRKKHLVIDGTAQDFHKSREAREHKRNAEESARAKEVFTLLHRPELIKAEIARVQGDIEINETDKERQVKVLKQALVNLEKADEDKQRVCISFSSCRIHANLSLAHVRAKRIC